MTPSHLNIPNIIFLEKLEVRFLFNFISVFNMPFDATASEKDHV